MHIKKFTGILFPLTIISFIIISNIYIEINRPLVQSGGCNEKEYDAIQYIIDNLDESEIIFTDLRLYSILNELSNQRVVVTPGSIYSSQEDMNVTYQAFYSNNSFKAYYCIKNLLKRYYDFKESFDFYVLFSKLYVEEGIATFDYVFGPISLESYEKYLNSKYFDVLYQNEESFLVKAEVIIEI